MGSVLAFRMPRGPRGANDSYPGEDEGPGGGPGVVPEFSIDYFASAVGSPSGNGSELDPWDLQTVLDGAGGALAGKTVALRGNAYHNAAGWHTGPGLVGTNPEGSRSSAGKVKLRAYPGEYPVLTDHLVIDQGANIWLYDIEIANTNVGSLDTMGVDVHAPNVGLIRCWSHDHSGNGFGMWVQAAGSWMQECRSFNNGFTGSAFPTGESYGHGYYTQHAAGVPQYNHNSIAWNNFGYGFHSYGSDSTFLADLDFDGCVAFDNGRKGGSYNWQIGGSTPLVGLKMRYCWGLFYTGLPVAGNAARIGFFDVLNTSGDIQNCYFIGSVLLSGLGGMALEFAHNQIAGGYWQILTVDSQNHATPNLALCNFHDNQYGMSSSPSRGSVDFAITRASVTTTYTFDQWKSQIGGAEIGSTRINANHFGLQVMVRPNVIDPTTATIAVHDPAGAGLVSVPASKLAAAMNVGDNYSIAHDYNRRVPVVSGTWGGGDIVLPMTGYTPPAMLGGSLRGVAPANASPYVGTFLLRRSS